MPERRGPIRCSFCGKDESRVRKIVAGPAVYICNECVYLCVEVLNEEHIATNKPKPKE